MKTLGILGGMGPLATNYFYSLVINKRKVLKENEHIKTIIYSNPQIPDRTTYILNNKEENPINELIEGVKFLEKVSDHIIIACNTAHFFYEEMYKYSRNKLINMVEVTANYIERNFKDKVIVLLSTKGTYKTRLYFDYFEGLNIKYKKLSSTQLDNIMNVITNIKVQGVTEEGIKKIKTFINEIHKDNYIYLSACTEISLIYEKLNDENTTCIDSSNILIDYVLSLFD